jgi:nucleotide-binding universal stress UspA family protein
LFKQCLCEKQAFLLGLGAPVGDWLNFASFVYGIAIALSSKRGADRAARRSAIQIWRIMRNIKNLLIPIDFSPESERALKYAAGVAAETGAQMVVLYVIEDVLQEGILNYTSPPEGYSFFQVRMPEHPLDDLLRERSLDLWNFVDTALRGNRSLGIKRIVRLGKVRTEIRVVAREEAIDLIVLELRNRSRFTNRPRRKLLKALNKLPYPVLVPPPDLEEISRRGKRIPAFWRFLPAESTA